MRDWTLWQRYSSGGPTSSKITVSCTLIARRDLFAALTRAENSQTLPPVSWHAILRGDAYSLRGAAVGCCCPIIPCTITKAKPCVPSWASAPCELNRLLKEGAAARSVILQSGRGYFNFHSKFLFATFFKKVAS